MSVETKRIGGGFTGLVGHLVDAASAIPGNYGRLFGANRRKTIVLTVLAILAVTYPLINQVILAPFSRNAFELPLPDDTTVWNLGFRFGLNSFTAAVLGGIGNLQGAVLGALVLGFINAFSDRYFSANWTNAIVFGVLIAILVFKPTGLLGQQLAERA